MSDFMAWFLIASAVFLSGIFLISLLNGEEHDGLGAYILALIAAVLWPATVSLLIAALVLAVPVWLAHKAGAIIHDKWFSGVTNERI